MDVLYITNYAWIIMVSFWRMELSQLWRKDDQTKNRRKCTLCLRRLLALAIFLLPWTICNSAPLQLSDYKNSHWLNDTLPTAGTAAATHKKHQNNNYHDYGSVRGCKHDHGVGDHRHHRRHGRHRSKDSNNDAAPLRRSGDTVNELPSLSTNILNEIPTYVSDLVAFSPVKPADPPWPPEAVMSAGMSLDMNEVDAIQQQQQQRIKRSTTGAGEPYKAVCEPTSNWVKKTWAYDLFGQIVTVVDEITTTDGEQMKQWFYQTNCKRTQESQAAPQPCAGIDEMYESECEEKRSFVYAVVSTPKGEQGWNWVTISTSCNCAFRKRPWNARSSVDHTQPTLSRE